MWHWGQPIYRAIQRQLGFRSLVQATKGYTQRTGNGLIHISGLPGKDTRNQRGKPRSKSNSRAWGNPRVGIQGLILQVHGDHRREWSQKLLCHHFLPLDHCICTCAHDSNSSPWAPRRTVCRVCSQPLPPPQHRQAGHTVFSNFTTERRLICPKSQPLMSKVAFIWNIQKKAGVRSWRVWIISHSNFQIIVPIRSRTVHVQNSLQLGGEPAECDRQDGQVHSPRVAAHRL